MSPKIQELLGASGVAFRLHPHQNLVTFEDAKAALPFDPAAMVKALVFRLPDARYAIIGMRAADRADYKKIADALSVRRADLRAATADEVATDLDMQPGGIMPMPVNGALVLFDRAVGELGTIYCGTGRNNLTLEIMAADLIRVSGGRLAELTKAA
jgi:Cys-tRNA(Pro)/Cys-tRNA(Cys) deacylase